MGLDIHLLKFKIADAQEHLSVMDQKPRIFEIDGGSVDIKARRVDYDVGSEKAHEVAYMRRNYLARRALCSLVGNDEECEYIILDAHHLSLIEKFTNWGDHSLLVPDELEDYELTDIAEFKQCLRKLIEALDPATELAAFKWSS